MSIKIAIADDHKIYRDGLKVGLARDINLQIVLEAENGQELLDGLENNLPNVILMDLKMPIMDGIEATKAVRQKYSSIKILIVTMYDDAKFITHLMENGANGYLLKTVDPEEIIKAIHSVHESGYYFNKLVKTSPKTGGTLL